MTGFVDVATGFVQDIGGGGGTATIPTDVLRTANTVGTAPAAGDTTQDSKVPTLGVLKDLLADQSGSTRLPAVANITDRDAVTGMNVGDVQPVTDSDGAGTAADYWWTGAGWQPVDQAETTRTVANSTERDALTGLAVNDRVWVDDDDGNGGAALYRAVAVTDGAWATSTMVKIAGGATAPKPAEAVIVSEVNTDLPAAAANTGKLYILRTIANDETYLSDGAAWLIQPDADVGAECYVKGINAVITWDGVRWGSGSIVPVQMITVTADRSLDTRFSTAWKINAGLTDVTVTLTGDTKEPVKISNGSSRAAIFVLPDGGNSLRVRPRVNATFELSQDGSYVWVS